ncbi:MAG: fold metallo-hydrolase [Candidatus Saccharibacteria bacterium]|nr:fold metallo-hydrolase [Candidatus Saccharibacteria bacterium]
MFQKDIVPGIHRIEHAYTNFYVVEEAGRLTVVDTSFPKSWGLLLDILSELEFDRKDIAAIIITHAHFDHLGFAARAQAELGIPVWVHTYEAYIARHPYRYDHEKNRVLYPLLHPRSLPIQMSMIKAGALAVPGLKHIHKFENVEKLEVPGSPKVIFVPGHTHGHCAFYFEERGALLTGDALVTLNPYTGETGPQIISGAATADSAEALVSLDKLLIAKDSIILPGHGEPWKDGVAKAVGLARDKGAS